MDAYRTVVLATVVGVKDGHVLYPCCIQCYAKMLHNIKTNLWQCVRCRISCRESDLMWRYRLSLFVADSTARCNVSLFGGTLVQHFGCSAQQFHQYIHSPHGDRLGIDEETVLQAVRTTLIGNKYLFCLKSNIKINTKQDMVQAHPPRGPLCVSDLVDALHSSQRPEGKPPELIGVQMIRTNTWDTDFDTVLDVLKYLIGEQDKSEISSSRDSLRVAASQQKVYTEKRSDVNTSFSSQALQKMKSQKFGENHCCQLKGKCSQCVCVHTHEGVFLQTENDQGGSLLESLADNRLSQNSSESQTSAMFSCQSSMDREFPPGVNNSFSVRMSGRRSCGVGKKLEDSQEQAEDKSFCVFDPSTPWEHYQNMENERPEPSASSSCETECHSANYEKRDNFSSCEQNGEKVCHNTNSKIPVSDKDYIDHDVTKQLADNECYGLHLSHHMTETSHDVLHCGHSQVGLQHSNTEPDCSFSRGRNKEVSFSTSLNDSSLLLTAFEENKHVPVQHKPDQAAQEQLHSKKITFDLSEESGSGVQCDCERSARMTEKPALPTDSMHRCTDSEKLTVLTDTNIVMPDSEDLSLFLDGLVLEKAVADETTERTLHFTTPVIERVTDSALVLKPLDYNGSDITGSKTRRKSMIGHSKPSEKYCASHTSTKASLVSTEKEVENISAEKVQKGVQVHHGNNQGNTSSSELSTENRFHDNSNRVLSSSFFDNTFSIENGSFCSLPAKTSDQIGGKGSNSGKSDTLLANCQSEKDTSPSKNKSNPCVHKNLASAVKQSRLSLLIMPDSEDLDEFLDNMAFSVGDSTADPGRSDNSVQPCHQSASSTLSVACKIGQDNKVSTTYFSANNNIDTNNRKEIDIGKMADDQEVESQHVVVKLASSKASFDFNTNQNLEGNRSHCYEDSKEKSAQLQSVQREEYVSRDEQHEGMDSFLDGSAQLFSSQDTDGETPGITVTERQGSDCSDYSCSTPLCSNLPDSNRPWSVGQHDRSGADSHHFVISESFDTLKNEGKNTSVSSKENDIMDDTFHDESLVDKESHPEWCQTSLMTNPVKQVRFSRKRRISSIKDIDVRLEQYLSPQPDNKLQCVPGILTETPQRSCLRQCLTPRNLLSTPSLQTSSGRLPLTPITVIRNIDTTCVANRTQNKTQHCSTPLQTRTSMTVRKLSQTSHFQQEPCAALGNSTASLPPSPEISGSQDLFSPSSAQEHGQSAFSQASLKESPVKYTPQSSTRHIQKCQRWLSVDDSDSDAYRSQSLFDSPETLFDEGQNLPERGSNVMSYSHWMQGVGSKQTANLCVKDAVLEQELLTDMEEVSSVDSSTVLSASADLFSP